MFTYELRQRLGKARPQISSDGLPTYKIAIEKAFGDSVDYATINKELGKPEIIAERHQQPELIMMRKAAKIGEPDEEKISTTSVERQHATLRHMSSRYSRQKYTMSKKLRNNRAALALHYPEETWGTSRRGFFRNEFPCQGITGFQTKAAPSEGHD